MSKFCPNCGVEVSNDVTFCPNCGGGIGKDVQKDNVKPGNKSKVKILVIIVAIVGLLVVLCAVFGEKGYENVAEKYVESVLKGNAKKARKCLVYDIDEIINEAIDSLKDENNMSESEVLEYIEEDWDYNLSDVEDIYPEVIRRSSLEENENVDKVSSVKVNAMAAVEVSKRELRSEYEEYCVDYVLGTEMDLLDFIDTDKIKKAYRVTCDVDICYEADGDDCFKSYDATVFVVKYGAKWKVLADLF